MSRYQVKCQDSQRGTHSLNCFHFCAWPSLVTVTVFSCSLEVGKNENSAALTFHERREQGDVGGFPSSSRKVQANFVQLLPQGPASVFGFCSVGKRMLATLKE